MAQTYEQEPESTYQPTAAQMTREVALRRFNRRFVYAPLVAGVVICAGILGLLLWQTAVAPLAGVESYAGYARRIASGLADTLFVLFSLPLLLCSLVLPLAVFGAYFYGRSQGLAPLKRLQFLFWRLESLIVRFSQKIIVVNNQVAAIVTRASSELARFDAGGRRLIGIHLRSDESIERTLHDES